MENKNLKEENAANVREIKLLSSEMNLLDGEKDRLRNENVRLFYVLGRSERRTCEVRATCVWEEESTSLC